MPTYRWTGVNPQPDTTSTTPLGYPWVEVDAEGKAANETELAAATADAVLSDVGTDKTKAAAALKTENKRKTPRTALTKKLKKISE